MPRGVPDNTGWKARQRRGLPSMTRRMMAVLKRLHDAKKADWPFVALPDVHKRTLNALIARNWIFESPGLDGVRYTITARGEKALKIYEPAERRVDGMCPDCGNAPRHILPSGKVYGYCFDCMKRNRAKNAALKGGYHKNPDALCPRCNKRKRQQYPSGFIASYCKRCNSTLKRQGRRKRRKKALQAVLAGGAPPTCRLCEQPCYYTHNSIYDVCIDHWKVYQQAYRDRRRPDSRAARQRRSGQTGGRASC